MQFEPLRFVHACNLYLDHQLADTGLLPEESHTLVQDATFEAFERVVAVCLDRRADFLLLTGNSFDQLDRSVRAQSALRAGLHRLAASGIRTCVAPGELGPAWPNLGVLPEDAKLFSHASEEPFEVQRDGRVIATIRPLQNHSNATGQSSDVAISGRRPFSIGMPMDTSAFDVDGAGEPSGNTVSADENGTLAESLLPRELTECGVDYLALAGAQARRTISLKSGVAHHPGSTQGLTPNDRGPLGCTLVDVGSNGQIDTNFMPTAPVRWEGIVLHLDSESTRGQLLARMRTALDQCRPEVVEKMWLCQWTIQGFGALFESLYEIGDEILGSLKPSRVGDRELHVAHSMCLLPAATEAASLDDRFALEYFERMAEPDVFSPPSLQEHLSAAAIPEAAGSHRLHSLIAELDPDVIAGHSHRLGMTLFGVKAEEGPPHEVDGHSY